MVSMPLEGGPYLAGGHVPQLDVLEVGEIDRRSDCPRCKGLPVGGERNTAETALVLAQGCPLLACGHVPQFQRSIVAGRSQGLAIRAECHGHDRTGMSL